jgi:predicted nuclease of predicted toxin-antitoxin system
VRILLDECLDWRLGRELPGHEVKTVQDMGWAGIKNGRLLALAESDFQVFVTGDRNLSFQQNLPRFAIAVVVLKGESIRLITCVA